MPTKICAARRTSPPPMDEDDDTGIPVNDVVYADGSTSVLEEELVVKTGKNEVKEAEANEAASKKLQEGEGVKEKEAKATESAKESEQPRPWFPSRGSSASSQVMPLTNVALGTADTERPTSSNRNPYPSQEEEQPTGRLARMRNAVTSNWMRTRTSARTNVGGSADNDSATPPSPSGSSSSSGPSQGQGQPRAMAWQENQLRDAAGDVSGLDDVQVHLLNVQGMA
ncbi:unnamed protein product [Amoebophrya sp. A120]|nr:unnamed protein product [Amoebophrya sp. A120]|eukprot:GSA120T00008539001.1